MTTTHTPTVLVCDEEIDLCEMLAEYVGNRGHRVIAAYDAAAIRERLAEYENDLILLDVNTRGRTACRRCATCGWRTGCRW